MKYLRDRGHGIPSPEIFSCDCLPRSNRERNLSQRFYSPVFSLTQEFWLTAEAESCGLAVKEFSILLTTTGTKVNYGFPHGIHPDPTQKAAFFRALHLSALALAHSWLLAARLHPCLHFAQYLESSLDSPAVAKTLKCVSSEDRFLLSSYFLDHQTLLQIARLLHVHEATISRRLKRLVADLRKQLLHNL
jgi:hypothetical protein